MVRTQKVRTTSGKDGPKDARVSQKKSAHSFGAKISQEGLHEREIGSPFYVLELWHAMQARRTSSRLRKEARRYMALPIMPSTIAFAPEESRAVNGYRVTAYAIVISAAYVIPRFMIWAWQQVVLLVRP